MVIIINYSIGSGDDNDDDEDDKEENESHDVWSQLNDLIEQSILSKQFRLSTLFSSFPVTHCWFHLH